ncbi:TRAP transporter substrate-binding protein [Natrinema gelatinilyticum]|uniref:TRAP transporter substrate-binding protein n=1 Tax=Natrinema gelatinilyticum TaxID=2961571 RepID=UPI0020C4C472|nr:TRAP transporter substrate-binding protein DctP [Natrinema gelatinilyticum]
MSREISRRSHLQLIGGAAFTTGVAGCVSTESGGNGVTEYTVSTYYSESFGCRDCINPTPLFDMPERIEKESNGQVKMDLVADGQLTGSADGGSKAQSNIVQAADGSVGNSAAFWPENQIFLIPYTFPSRRAYSHAIFHPKVWENYWVPFAKKYNIFPLLSYVPTFRQVYLSEEGTKKMGGGRLRDPSQLEGLSIRRTESRVAQEVLDTWGANPVEVSWGDTIQGMETGVVDGLETWSSTAIGFGMGEVIDQVVHLDFKSGYQMQWVNTDWLQSIPEEHMQAIADVTRKSTEEMVHIAEDVVFERVGETQPPKEGSAWDELGVTVNVLDDDELKKWKDPVDPIKNSDMWKPEKDLISNLNTPRDDIWQLLYDVSREDSVPDSDGEFTIDAWWDDYLDDL